MSDDSQNSPVEVSAVPAVYEYPAAEAPPLPAGPNPLAVVHSLLRGRYHWAVLLALALAVPGAILGYRLPPVTYRSSAIIQIKPSRERILYQSELNSALPMFDSFIESQAQLVSSQEVLNLAINGPEWEKTGREQTEKVIADFRQSVEVEHPKNTELLILSFTDRERIAAKCGAKAVVDAYHQIFWSDRQLDDPAKTMDQLGKLKGEKVAQAENYTQLIRQYELEYHTQSLQRVIDDKIELKDSLEREKAQVDLSLASAPKESSAPGEPSGSPVGSRPAELTAEQLAETDGQLKGLLATRRDLDVQRQHLEAAYGPQWHSVHEARADLDRLDGEIAQRVERLNREPAAAIISHDPLGQSVSPAALRARQKYLEKTIAQINGELKTITAAKFSVEDNRAKLEAVNQEVSNISARLEQLKVESQSKGRYDLVSEPDLPQLPFKDRRVPISAGCGAGGVALAFGLVAGWGLLNRRFRSLGDARQMLDPSVRVLGVLPHLQTRDLEEMSTASHCLHHIRTALQVFAEGPEERVFAVTSPSPGAGKTSLTLALGLSFAAARSRTLLIDCDMFGGGLSTKVDGGGRRRLGEILCRRARLNPAAVGEALAFARSRGLRLGEALVRRGLVSSEVVGEALEAQRSSRVGLLDVLSGEPLEACVVSPGVAGLDVLPLGEASPAHVAQLSPQAMRRIIAEARAAYDTILIDTGPLSGSLEATVACAEADKVVVVLPRGESYATAKSMVRLVSASGFRMAGVVFNRATATDLLTSGVSSSHSSGRSRPRSRTAPLSDRAHGDFIADAVASTTAGRR